MKKLSITLAALTATLLLFGCNLNQGDEQQTTDDDDDNSQEEVQTSTTNISVTAPEPYSTVTSPVEIQGEARVFEAVFQYRVVDDNGDILAEGTGYANAPDIGQFGSFDLTVPFKTENSGSGAVEVFVYSAADGSVQELVSIPVTFN